MVSTEVNLMTSDLVGWSLQVNENQVTLVLLLLFFVAPEGGVVF
jgi:hypothetical protein